MNEQSKRPAPSPAQAPLRIFVRRGALRRFDRLKREAAALPVSIEWDRRTHQRRQPGTPATGERRKGDRRQKPSFMWEAADFLVAQPAPSEPEQNE